MVNNLLIRAPNWVGDLVMATSGFRDLRRGFPGARIAVIVPRSRAGVLAGADHHDELIIEPGRSLAAAVRLGRELGRRRFDLALIYPNSLRSAVAPFVARVPERIGYRGEFRRWLLTRSIPEPEYRGRPEGPGPRRLPEPMVHRYAAILAAAGVKAGEGRPELAVSEACEERARLRRAELGIAPGERLVGLNPGASFGASKLWPVERFARAADLITARTGLRTILFVGPGEEEIARRIAELSRSGPISTASAPLDLDLLKPFVRDLALLITTDTGPRQYAVAFQVPVVAVMGPTHPGYSAAHLDETEVIRRDVPCGPCHLKVCPLDHRCMTLIEPEEVAEKALGLLEKFGKRV